MEEMFPEFWRMTQEHLFGEVWSRPGLALRDRSLITMAALMVLGRSEELKGHMGYALNIGISREEVLEMAMHLAHYAGWPVGVGALRVAKEVFSSRE
jgi:4-carboxymuconolactone decarboxylase